MGNLQKKPEKERVLDFQRKIYLKAKQEKTFRFYVLYDKMRLPYILKEAYKRCKSKGGSPGIDGISFEHIEKEGVDEFLEIIKNELESKTYKPEAVLRVYIPKSNGKERPLGIPTIKDRVVQMCCKLVIEPIFEADFEEESYGFRPKRSTHDAIRKIKENLKSGLTEIYDADLSSYFDTIPHTKLLSLVGKRISDKNILHLIKLWLKAPIYENNKYKGGKKNKRGTPQGGVISPLLANIYLNLVDKAVNRDGGIFKRSGIRIVRYADDFVLMANKLSSDILSYLKGLLQKMELRINESKSRVVNAKEEIFNFLGFTIRYDNDKHGKTKKYWNIIPEKESEKKVRRNINECFKKIKHLSPLLVSKRINEIMRGWINYYTIPGVTYSKRSRWKLKQYLFDRLNKYYRNKSQRKSKFCSRGALKILIKKYGLIDPISYSPVRI